MSDQACTDALLALSLDVAVLSSKMDGMTDLMDKWTSRLEGMLNRMDIRLQEQERVTTAQAVRIASEKEARETQDRQIHVLSNRVWALGGGSGILAGIALFLQAMGW